MRNPLISVALGLGAFVGAVCIAARAQNALPSVAAPVATAETNVSAHDPSTIIERDGTYWVYSTGRGLQQFSSPDRRNWTRHQPVLAQAPDWVAQTSPRNTNNNVWAPDVHKIGETYYLYYSYSEFGTNHSGIGVATSATLAPDSWKPQGLVISSGAQTNFNAIDPAVFDDAEGKPWMVFGSFFSGIKLVALDPTNGKLAQPVKIFDVATRPGVNANPIEAASIYYHDGYYYLWVNWDTCCAGARSQYNVRVGRSRTVTGPYLDKSGVSMMEGGGSLFLDAIYDDGSGRPVDDQIGPGHVGILREGDNFWLSTHYEWARDRGGATTLNVQPLAWDGDGWPRAVLPAGPYKIVSALASHGLLTPRDNAAGETAIETMFDRNAPAQRWTFNHLGDGFYSIINAASQGALSVVGDAKIKGAKIELAPFTKRAGQMWQARANEDGTYTLLSRSSESKVALEVNGCKLGDGTGIETSDSNEAPCQKWSLRAR